MYPSTIAFRTSTYHLQVKNLFLSKSLPLPFQPNSASGTLQRTLTLLIRGSAQFLFIKLLVVDVDLVEAGGALMVSFEAQNPQRLQNILAIYHGRPLVAHFLLPLLRIFKALRHHQVQEFGRAVLYLSLGLLLYPLRIIMNVGRILIAVHINILIFKGITHYFPDNIHRNVIRPFFFFFEELLSCNPRLLALQAPRFLLLLLLALSIHLILIGLGAFFSK